MNVLKAHCDQRSVSKNSKSIYFPLVLNENELEQTFQFFAELWRWLCFLYKKNETNKNIM